MLDFEVSHQTNLIDTVGCYLNHNCNVQSAATELFIHPNTLKYRLEKVQKISGLDFTDHEKKLEVQLAIKIYKYYGDSLWEF